MVNCVIREGGIRADQKSLIAELVHAYGGAKQVPRGLIRKEGKGGLTDSQVASRLYSLGYYRTEEDDNYDENLAREALVSCAHGWGSCSALPEKNYCVSERLACEDGG